LLLAFDGVIVAVSVYLSPGFSDSDVGDKATPVTTIGGGETVTAQVAVLFPEFVVTVIVAFPAATAETTPAEFTVATEVLLELQLTLLSEAFDGVTVAFNV
jgi:hypothetical protein